MTLKKKQTLAILISIAVAILLTVGFVLIQSKKTNPELPATLQNNNPDTFTFFGVGPDTPLSGDLRDQLEELLGNDSVETRTTIDLIPDGVEPFAENFPRIESLQQALNYLPRQRVEHDTVQLTYRYARQQSVPFDRIQIVFWQQNNMPLFISLWSKRDGEDFIENIQNKYGDPGILENETDSARTLFWEKENALLLISITRNRIGFNEYDFGIYYLDNLDALAKMEKSQRDAAEREKEKTGELAF